MNSHIAQLQVETCARQSSHLGEWEGVRLGQGESSASPIGSGGLSGEVTSEQSRHLNIG